MILSRRNLVLHILFLLSLIFAQNSLSALDRPKQNLKGVDYKLAANVADAIATDTTGKEVDLIELIKVRPTILLPVYYRCPRLCGILFDSLFAVVKDIPLKLGEDYQIIAFSFNPKEKIEDSTKKLDEYVAKYKLNKDGLKFLIADKPNIDNVMQSIGFIYQEDGNDYAHAAVAVFVSPTGKITHYFTGVAFEPKAMRLALIESSEGKLGTILDHVLLYCYRFDQYEGRYSIIASRVVRMGTVTIVIMIALFMFRFVRKKQLK